MPRRNRNARRQSLRQRVESDVPSAPQTGEQMALSLVQRGLASPRVLDAPWRWTPSPEGRGAPPTRTNRADRPDPPHLKPVVGTYGPGVSGKEGP